MVNCRFVDIGSPYLNKLDVLTDDEKDAVGLYLEAATAAVQDYCGRKFLEDTYDEMHTAAYYSDGWGVMVGEFPIINLLRVTTSKAQKLKVQNTTAKHASVWTKEASLVLRSITSGSVVLSELQHADNATLGDLVTSIGALDGWTSEALTGESDAPTSDLVPGQFVEATTATWLEVWDDDDTSIEVEAETGIIKGFSPRQKVRINYTAGFTADTIPEPIRKVVADTAILMFDKREGVTSMSVGGDFFALSTEARNSLGMNERRLLNHYKDRKIV